MDPIARQRQEQRYQQHLAAKAAQRAAQEAEEAAKVKKQRQDALHQKIKYLAQKRLRYTHFDWAATKLVSFFRNRIQSRPRTNEPVVNVFGDSYPFSLATQFYDVEEEPFDTPEARSAYDAALRKQQNHLFFSSRDRQLTPDEVVLFLLACLCKDKQPDVELLFGIFDDDSTFAHLFSLNLHDHPDISRAIRLLNLLQNQGIPPPIFENLPPCNLEEITVSLVQDIQFQLEEIRKSQARLEETFCRPNPDDEVQCTICEKLYFARNMHSYRNGNLLYCTGCAPIAGIFPQGFFADDGGERQFPPYPPMPI
jgi:hypothetical protein